MGIALCSEVLDGFGVGGELGVVLRGIGEWRRQLLVQHGTQEHPANPGVTGILLDGVHEPGQVGDEFGQPRLACERVGHAVAEEDDGRFQQRDGIGQLLEPGFGRFAVIEPDARLAGRCVPAPAEVAKDDLAIWELCGEKMLDVAVGFFAFNERVANEHDAVAVAQVEDVGVLRGRATGCEAEDERGDEQHKEKTRGIHRRIAAAFDR